MRVEYLYRPVDILYIKHSSVHFYMTPTGARLLNQNIPLCSPLSPFKVPLNLDYNKTMNVLSLISSIINGSVTQGSCSEEASLTSLLQKFHLK